MSINICADITVCRYYSVLLVSHSSQIEKPQCVCTAPFCFTQGINLWMDGPHVHVLCHPWFLLDVVLGGVARDVLKGLPDWPENLARNLLTIQGRGNINNSVHCFFWFWIDPSAKGSLSDFLCNFSFLVTCLLKREEKES